MSTPVDIAPAKGKLGVLLVGLGAVSTTTIAGVLAIRKGISKPIGSLTQMGTIRLGKRTDNRAPKISRVRSARRTERHRFWRMGHLQRQLLRSGQTCGRARRNASRSDQRGVGRDQADAGGVRSALREAARRSQRQEGQEQEGSRRSAHRGHPQLQAHQQLRSDGGGLGGQHRDLYDRGPVPQVAGRAGTGPARERSGDCVQHDLRLCGDQRRHPVCERRAEPECRSAGAAGTRGEDRSAGLSATT